MEFVYKARTKEGKIETDVLESPSRKEAVAELKSREMLPLSLREKKAKGLRLPKQVALFSRISLDEKLIFIKNLSVMIKSGVAVPKALKILSQQTSNKKFKKVLSEMSRGVEQGVSLSQSFAKRSDIFSGLYVSLVEVGEAGGNLEQSLDYLGKLLKRQSDLVRKTKGALMYPFVVLATLVLVGILMFIFVLPKLTSTFTDLSVELPILTRALVAAVDIFSRFAVLIIIGLIGLVMGGVYFLRSDTGIRYSHKFLIGVPIISGISQKINMARFTLVLGSLLKSGMQIVGALQIASKGMQNVFYREAVEEAAEKVKVGVMLSQVLEKHSKLFPSLVVQMIKVGEESGTMENVLKEVGEHYEEEVDQVMKNMSAIIEPVLVVVIGAVVAVIAVALIMPIYSITQAI